MGDLRRRAYFHEAARALTVTIAAAVSAVCGCASVLGLDGLEKSDTAEPSLDASLPRDGAPNPFNPPTDAAGGSDVRVAPITDGGFDAGEGSVAVAPNRCPFGRGATMAELPVGDGHTYCIDTTETTQAQYDAFLVDTAKSGGVGTSGQESRCTWNTSYAPTCAYHPDVSPLLPVVCVDWCDAMAFCRWAGKRMCGQIGGGPLPGFFDGIFDSKKSQWHAACTHSDLNTYPYGSTYDGNACNGADRTPAGVADVGSVATCVGGYADLRDMSGNVREYEDACDESDAGPKASVCHARGGSATSDTKALRCDSNFSFEVIARDRTRNDVGIRCCAD